MTDRLEAPGRAALMSVMSKAQWSLCGPHNDPLVTWARPVKLGDTHSMSEAPILPFLVLPNE